MKKILTLFVALVAALGISAENYFLKSSWGEAEASWKQMTDDDGTYSIANVFFDGKDVAINTEASDEGARIIKVENINAMINYDPAQIAAGDSVLFVYDPESYVASDPAQSGLIAMVNFKKGYALKVGESWRDLSDDDEEEHDWWSVENVEFDGKNVQLAHESQISVIKAANIAASINTDPAEFAAGDRALFIFRPSLVNSFDEKESGLQAMITFKKGYALKNGSSWKDLVDDDEEDHDWWILEDVELAGASVSLMHESAINVIKAENINAYINYDDAELAVGDRAMIIFRPSLANAFNEKESGMQAMITFKNGYALKSTWGDKTASWKDLAKQDEDTYLLEDVLFDGKDVVLINGSDVRTIKAQNITAYLLPSYEVVELEAGDIVTFMYTPSEYNSYDETQPGLFALVAEKHGYALKSNFGEGVEWKEMTKQDDDTFIIENVIFDGKDVKINNFAGDEGARTIKVENITAYLLPSYEVVELEAGDIVTFMYTPSEYSSYDETKSGLYALIIEKHNETGVANTTVETKAVKMIQNGQLFIIRNGKMYNAAGVSVK